MRLLLSAFGLVFLAGLASCGGNNSDRFRERAQIEGEAAATAENDVRKGRASELEADLGRRHRFNQAVAGTFEGSFKTSTGIETRVRLRVFSSLPPYTPGNRVRTLEEIQKDLETLYLNASLKLLGEAPRSGCNFTQIKPDLGKAEFNLVRESCSESASIRVNTLNQQTDGINSTGQGRILPNEILEGRINQIDRLYITLSSLDWTRDVNVVIKRVSDSTEDSINDSDVLAGTTNSAQRVLELEKTLAARMSILDRLSGTYSSSVVLPSSYPNSPDLKLTFDMTLYFQDRPVIPTDRLRSEDEVRKDIEKLHLKVEVLEKGVPFTCVFDNVKPDLATGRMNLVSQECNVKTFALSLDDPQKATELKMDALKRDLSEKVVELFVDFRLRGVSYPMHFQKS